MKNLFITLITLFSITYLSAQDQIILRNGDDIEAKVTEITPEHIKGRNPIITKESSKRSKPIFENYTTNQKNRQCLHYLLDWTKLHKNLKHLSASG